MHWKPRTLFLRLALPLVLLGGAGAGILLASLPAAASAALPAPGGVGCYGNVSAQPDNALEEPDNLGYLFSCTGPITAYSIIVDRVKSDGDNVDDYNNAPEIIADGSPSTTESVQCGGSTPSNGIGCYSLDGAVAGPIGADFTVEGSVDLTNPYCSYLPTGANPGTPAIPRAVVELVVTDTTGAQDGPFELNLNKKCAAVPAVVPKPKVKAKPKTKPKAKPKTTRTKAAATAAKHA